MQSVNILQYPHWPSVGRDDLAQFIGPNIHHSYCRWCALFLQGISMKNKIFSVGRPDRNSVNKVRLGSQRMGLRAIGVHEPQLAAQRGACLCYFATHSHHPFSIGRPGRCQIDKWLCCRDHCLFAEINKGFIFQIESEQMGNGQARLLIGATCVTSARIAARMIE